MASEIDYNKIAAELIQSYITTSIKSIVEGGDSLIKSVQNKLKISYTKYLKSSIKKFSKTKTVLYRDKAVPLYDFYEHVLVKHGSKLVNTQSISEIFSIDEKLIITGTAGSGKSTLLKHLFLNSIIGKHGIPVFVELRNLNKYNGTLEEYAYDTVYNLGFILEKKYFIQSLQSGGLIIFLDGYDEIKNEIKSNITRQVFELVLKYSKNKFIVSSRPDDEFISWNEFSELRVQPLNKEQAYRLVEKLNYDESVKSKFLTQLKEHLYTKHKDFLSIPLLLTIMLMTYGQNADIPSKMHIFYSQVFDTLFNKHDATKAVYHRKMFTNLAIDDFKTVLSAFAILSYSKHLSTFTSEETLALLSQSKKITGIKFKENLYLKDLLKSVCILSQDGLVYGFTHRTFQEFFSAIYIIHSDAVVQKKLLDALDWEVQSDKVLLMLFEMQPGLIEQKLILPKLRAFFKEFSPTGIIGDYERWNLFSHLFSALMVDDNNGLQGIVIRNSSDYKFCQCLTLFYPSLIKLDSWNTKKINEELINYYKKSKAYGSERIEFSKIRHDSDLGLILLSEPTNNFQYLDLMSAVLSELEAKYKERSKSIEEILFKK